MFIKRHASINASEMQTKSLKNFKEQSRNLLAETPTRFHQTTNKEIRGKFNDII